MADTCSPEVISVPESHKETATPSGDVEEDDCRLTVSSLYTLRRASKL